MNVWPVNSTMIFYGKTELNPFNVILILDISNAFIIRYYYYHIMITMIIIIIITITFTINIFILLLLLLLLFLSLPSSSLLLS